MVNKLSIGEIEKAKKELKSKLEERTKSDDWCESNYHYELHNLIMNLLGALDQLKMGE